MPAPNPIWGLHLAAGELDAACVRRHEDGSFEVLEHVHETTPPDDIGTLRAGLAFLRKKGVRGRAAFVALPDSRGCLVTARLPAEDADLSGTELRRELYDHTPFEEPEARIDRREVAGEGRGRTFVVGGLPVGRYGAYVELLGEGDFGLYGLGFAGSALFHGSRALGLVWDETFLLEIQDELAFLYAADGDEVHRYPIPFGRKALARAAATASGRPVDGIKTAIDRPDADPELAPFFLQAVHGLAEDVRATIAYHRECHRRTAEGEAAHAKARIVPVGPTARSPNVADALAAVFKDELDVGVPEPTVSLRGSAGGAVTPGRAGAIGAALEGFADEDDRLALRDPPDEVPEYTEERTSKAPLLAAVAAVAVVLAVVGVVALGTGPDEPATDGPGTVRDTGPDAPDAGTGDPETDPRLRALEQPLAILARRAALGRALGLLAAFTGGNDDGALKELSLEWTPGRDELSNEWIVRLQLAAPERFDADAGSARMRESPFGENGGYRLGGSPEAGFEIGVVARPPIRVRSVRRDAKSDLIPRLQETLALSGEPDLLQRTIARRAETDPTISGIDSTQFYDVPAPAARAALVLAGLVGGAGATEIRSVRARATDGKVQIRVGAVRLDASPLADDVLEMALPEQVTSEIEEQLALATTPTLLLAFHAPADSRTGTDPAALGARVREDGAVVLTLPTAVGTLRRRALPDGEWVAVPRSDAEKRAVMDDRVPGPGRYVWELTRDGVDPITVERDVEVPSAVVPLAADAPAWAVARGGTVRFRIDRRFAGRAVSAVSEPLAPGERIVARLDLGEGETVLLDSGFTFTSIERFEQVTERVRRVPVFRADGTILRDESGAPVTEERPVNEAETVFRARLRSPSGQSLDRAFEK